MYYSLENNFSVLQRELDELNAEEEFRLFGDIYFEINTEQSYITKVFKNFLNDIGISVSIIEEEEMFKNQYSYNVLDIHTLYKYNLKK